VLFDARRQAGAPWPAPRPAPDDGIGRDPLTGLADRRRWEAQMSVACADARENGAPVSLLLVDLDHLKRVNDVHGDAGGDEVLRQVAALLRPTVPVPDLAGRLGGDRFAVLLPGVGQARAVALAEELRCSIAGLPIEGFLPGEISMSVGVAEAVGAEAFPLELMARADEQLYRAKITRNAVGVRAPGLVTVDGVPDGCPLSRPDSDDYGSRANVDMTTTSPGSAQYRIGEDE
jgi:diguanylate cyclase (GGDEF)-like protein